MQSNLQKLLKAWASERDPKKSKLAIEAQLRQIEVVRDDASCAGSETQENDDRPFDPAELEEQVRKLKREGRLPSPEEFVGAAERIREKYRAKLLNSSQNKERTGDWDDYGTLSKPPSDEANAFLSSMTGEEKLNFHSLLGLLQESVPAGMILHPEARASLWGAALAKIADHYRATGRNDRALLFMETAWSLSKYPVFAFNAALLSLSVNPADVTHARTLLQTYLAEYQNVLAKPVLMLVNPEFTATQLEDVAMFAREELAALQSVPDAAQSRAAKAPPSSSANKPRPTQMAKSLSSPPELESVADGIAAIITEAFSSPRFIDLFGDQTLAQGWSRGEAFAVWCSLGHLALVVATWQIYHDKTHAFRIIDICRAMLIKQWKLSADMFETFRTIVNETEATAVAAFGACKTGSDLSLFFRRYVSRILGAPVAFTGRSTFEDQLSGIKYRGDAILSVTVSDLFVHTLTSVKRLLDTTPTD